MSLLKSMITGIRRGGIAIEFAKCLSKLKGFGQLGKGFDAFY
jgi:hypothetical protein